MTIKQADQINDTFNVYKDSIRYVKDSIAKQVKILDSLKKEYNFLKNAPNEYKWKYEANREIYFKREDTFVKNEKFEFLQKILLVGVIVLQFFSLK